MPLHMTRGSASVLGFGFGGGASGLFPFTTYTFISPATGSAGPTLGLLNPYYTGQPWYTSYFSVSNGVQIWTVPANGTYRLIVAGADGIVGGSGSYNGNYSRGAIITLDVTLQKGNELRMVVGQIGISRYVGNAAYNEGPGGGATAVSLNGGSLLAVAGGGGGQATKNTNNQSSSNASLTTTPNAFTFVDGGIQTTLATGGNGGYGSWSGGSSIYTGGGGGWNSAGQAGTSTYGGLDMTQSFGRALSSSSPTGGYTSSYGTFDSNEGGFGGGSAPQGQYTGSGAGGGYNGGNAGSYYDESYGMGGSSYWISGFVSSALKSAGTQSNGYVTVTKIS